MRCYICDNETDNEDDTQPERFICTECKDNSKDEVTLEEQEEEEIPS